MTTPPSASPRLRRRGAYASIRSHTPSYVHIRQHTSAYVSIRREVSLAPVLIFVEMRLQRRLRISAHLRTYETHALKEAVGQDAPAKQKSSRVGRA